jgi:glycine betaine/proline transport system ATP-binding protein
MEIRYHTDHSVFVMNNINDEKDDQQKIQGVIGDKELYHTLLGKMMLDD